MIPPLSPLDLVGASGTLRRWWQGVDAFLRGLGSAAQLPAETSLTSDSDQAVPTVKAVKAYADAISAGSVAAHEAALDPHPQYLTTSEGNALYALIASYQPITVASAVVATGATTPVAMFPGSWPRRFFASLSGSGSVSATVELWGTNTHDGDTLLLTFSLSGTGSDSADDWVETAWTSIWADVTALSGTSAAVTLTTEC